MITDSELRRLRGTFRGLSGAGTPETLSSDLATILGVSDVTISFHGVSDQFALGASSAAARTLSEWQFSLMEGPAIDGSTVDGVVDASESDDNPWPRLSGKARELGYRSIAGVPLHVDGEVFAVISLQQRDGVISAETMCNAERIAEEIAPSVLQALGPRTPLPDRRADHDIFHQATGMVMRQLGIGPHAAAALLREYAHTWDRLVTAVAADVVALDLDFGTLSPRPT